jgi:hypothetical protein
METFSKIRNNFKLQPDIWFFYGFLLTFTLSVRKVLFFYPINGQFNEYTGIYLYLSDIFLILTLLSWGYTLLCNNNNYLSTITIRLKLFHVEHSTRTALIVLPFILVIWAFSSTIWSDNKTLSLFRSIKILEFYGLYVYLIYKIVPRGTIFRSILRLISILGLFQAIIGIWQFIIQHSVGLFWLKESLISADIPGVAKLVFGGQKIIRAYGLFPHPNILGGFLLFSLTAGYVYIKMFHVEQMGGKNVPRGTFVKLLPLIVIIQSVALLMTFSKSAITALALSLVYMAYKIVPRGTKLLIGLKKMFHVEHFTRKLLLICGIILVLGIIFRPDTNSLLFKSLNERIFYLNVSRGTILAGPILGAGNGQSVLISGNFVPRGTIIEDWQYQPVHNIFLLIWSELGLIGLLMFLLILWKLFHVEQSMPKHDIRCALHTNDGCEVFEPTATTIVPRGTLLAHRELITILKGLVLGLIFIMLFDHYLWDIQQGEVLLWISMGLLVGISSIDKY